MLFFTVIEGLTSILFEPINKCVNCIAQSGIKLKKIIEFLLLTNLALGFIVGIKNSSLMFSLLQHHVHCQKHELTHF